MLKDVGTGLGVSGLNLDIYSDIVSSLIILKTYLLVKGDEEFGHLTSQLLILYFVMALSCVLSLIPRLYSLIHARSLMNFPEERKIKDWKHPVGLIKVEGMNVKALEFYGA